MNPIWICQIRAPLKSTVLSKDMSDSLFGTDGVRGRVGREPITPETVMKLGWAAGKVFAGAGEGDNKVLIGKDTRISGYLLESALEAGFSAAGVNVSLLGPMPTPGIAYLTRTARACAGVVISASHNPYDDNGIKIFSSEGVKLHDELVRQIDQTMQEPMDCVDSVRLGKAERFTDARGRYIEYCKNTFPQSLSLKSLKIVVDCANGAAYEVAPRVLSELGADVVVIANQPDGLNINDRCGSTDLALLKEAVLKSNADVGLAVDGDADRVRLVDRAGSTIDGDQILFVLAQQRLADNGLHGGVVGTVMTNLGLELALRALSIPFIRTSVGDRYVYETLKNRNWLLGGEASGHIICLDKSTTGDGIVAALEVLETMLKTGKSLSDLVCGMNVYPQHLVNVAVGRANGRQLVGCRAISEAVAQAEADLGKSGRVVLRPSGTEPLVRVMIEGENNAQVVELTERLANVVKSMACEF